MLFHRETLEGIAAGTVTLAFRRWLRPRVKRGTRMRTAIGVVEVLAVEQVEPGALTDEEASRAGFASRDAALAGLEGREGALYRVELRPAGPDPRIALREQADLDAEERRALRQRLERLDAASRRGPWTLETLRAIEARPATLAARLAASLGRDRASFKADVRKLKELGLTESLEVGYRLSPRGRAYLAALTHDGETEDPAAPASGSGA